MATTAKIAKEAEDAEVQGPAAQPLPPLRPAARLHAEVRAVPPVLPQAGARRRRHGRDEEQLVIESSVVGDRVMQSCSHDRCQMTR